MNTEIITNEMNIDEIAEEAIDACEATEVSNGKSFIVFTAIAAGVAGVIALVRAARKGKFDEMAIKKLEKKGYVVLKPDAADEYREDEEFASEE